jgi:hypothetical protein
LRIELHARVYGTGRHGPATVELQLGDGPAASLTFTDDVFASKEAEFLLPPNVASSRSVRLRIIRHHAISPAEAGEGEDTRKLGIMLRTLAVVWG